MSLPRAAWNEAEHVAFYREHNEEQRRELEARGEPADPLALFAGSLCPSTTTDAAGVFQLVLDVPSSSSYTAFGRKLSASGNEPRDGIEALRIERPGHDPVLVMAPAGTWTRVPDSRGWEHYADWDLGNVRVP
ncbi:MAG: hypothetical protein P1V36_07035 [Planctomycetota bacterium]|nr:hypothetical protein [Planctomycetota bacterium]